MEVRDRGEARLREKIDRRLQYLRSAHRDSPTERRKVPGKRWLSCDVLRDVHGVREHQVLLYLSGRMSPLAVVIADTHLPRRASTLPKRLLAYLKRADLILHAGDLIDPTLLDELAAYAPVLAVRGNLDSSAAMLPETVQFEFGGVRVAMIHDSGPKRGRRNRMRRRFPGARVVVFGHSHIPWLEDEEELLLLNPGSPTDRRRQPEHTFALLWAQSGEVRAEVLAL